MLTCRTVAEAKARTTHTLADMQADLESQKPFAFCKFGDGEMFCATGFDGHNADSHAYSGPLGRHLRQALRMFADDPRVYLGNWTWTPFGPLMHSLIDSWGLKPRWVPYYSLMHMAPLEHPEAMPAQDLGEVARFYRAVRVDKRRKVLVCPNKLSSACGFLRADAWVDCPALNGYDRYDDVLAKVRCQFTTNGGVLLTCYGMPAKPLIAAILTEFPRVTCIDIGSGLAPLFLGRTRSGQINTEEAWRLYPDIPRDPL